ncbi:MAG: hypothetical protein K2X81_17480, partial [Candidatus Obscuribacterales bacterium]|nr:hypothetical protein [Candidatus Obscuribacterales bacterium]
SSNARNLAAAQTDFSPKPEVKPAERTDSKPNTDRPAETSNQSANRQGQNQNNTGKEQETPNKESRVKEKENEPAKEETPFLKDEKEKVDNKAKDEQAAKDAKDKQNAKDDPSKSPEALEKQAAAKTAEQERQLARAKEIKEATSKEYTGKDYNKVLELSNKLDIPIIVEVGSLGKGPRGDWCGHCINFKNAHNRNEVDPLKTANGKALVVQVDVDLERKLADQVPGFNGGGVPYFNVVMPNRETGRFEAVGEGSRGFYGPGASEQWSQSRAIEIGIAQQRMAEQNRRYRQKHQ